MGEEVQLQQQIIVLKARVFDAEELVKEKDAQLKATHEWILQVAKAFNLEVTEQGIDINKLSDILNEAATDYSAKHPVQDDPSIEEVV